MLSIIIMAVLKSNNLIYEVRSLFRITNGTLRWCQCSKLHCSSGFRAWGFLVGSVSGWLMDVECLISDLKKG